jgi:hypothetical protein
MLAGGCLCGDVRYEADGPPLGSAICHCRICQQAHGAPMVAFITVNRSAFRLTSGEPKAYASSDHGTRRFCGRCGTQLFFEDSRYPEEFDIATATLDDPSAAPPTKHIWTMSQVSWVHLDDGLPVFPERSV